MIASHFVQSHFTHSPFIFGGGAGVGAAGPTTLSYQDESTSNAETITAPASIDAGDLLILLDQAVTPVSGPPTEVIPTGWTKIDSQADSIGRQTTSYKVADGSEDSASITGQNGSSFNSKIMFQFRGDAAISSINVSTVNKQITDNNPSSQTVLAAAGTIPLIVFGCYFSSGTVNPRTFTPAKDAETTTSNVDYFAYKIYNVSPSDTTVDMDDEGTTNTLMSFFVEAS